ncbi:MAG: hypothetical protein Q9211_001380 [Gyalolechia sp. 1 TL-2023]
MPRGNASQSKVHYQGKDEDFVILVDDVKSVQNWKDDRSIPLAQVVSGFKIFVTHKHGAQNVYDAASKQTLDNEFGTHNEDECMIKILEGGTLQETEVRGSLIPKPPSLSFPTGRLDGVLESARERRMKLWGLVRLIKRTLWEGMNQWLGRKGKQRAFEWAEGKGLA